MEKRFVSNILHNRRHWLPLFSIGSKGYPPPKKPVLIRFEDRSQILRETDTEIYAMEDMKLAFYTNPEHPDWKVCGPFPLYDYSLLSNKADISPSASITHWCPVSLEEMIGWASRLDPLHEWGSMQILVDRDRESTFYRTLLRATFVMRSMADCKSIDPEERAEYQKYAEVLSDMQACMDLGGTIQAGVAFHPPLEHEEDVIRYLIGESESEERHALGDQ